LLILKLPLFRDSFRYGSEYANSLEESKNEDGSEMIFGGFKVSSLEESSIKANEAIKIIKSHRDHD
jgi:hypothetical protein